MKSSNFPPYAKIIWLEDINAIQLKWEELHMPLEQFKEITDFALNIMSENKGTTWIADQYDSKGAFKTDVIEYITNELVGIGVAKYGIKLVATIMSKQSGLSSLSTKRWMGDVQKQEAFTMANFATLEDCKEWILANE